MLMCLALMESAHLRRTNATAPTGPRAYDDLKMALEQSRLVPDLMRPRVLMLKKQRKTLAKNTILRPPTPPNDAVPLISGHFFLYNIYLIT